MKTELRKVYRCEYCKKTMLSAGSMSRHEKYCRAKPENKHKCFLHCRYLRRNLKLMSDGDPENPYSYKTIFTCLSLNRKMYSVLIEKKMEFNPKWVKGLMRMPSECNMYEEMTYSEYEQRYNS